MGVRLPAKRAVADCIVLLLAFCAFLMRKKTNDSCFHIHTAVVSTWSHVRHVKKNAYHTPKQTLKNVATTKSNRPQNQTCDNFKAAPPTQREKQPKPAQKFDLQTYRGGGRSESKLFLKLSAGMSGKTGLGCVEPAASTLLGLLRLPLLGNVLGCPLVPLE